MKNYYNPVFESLTQQAQKFNFSPKFQIYEQTSDKLDAAQTEQFLTKVVDRLYQAIVKYATGSPLEDMAKEVSEVLTKSVDTLDKQTSVESLKTALYGIWKQNLEIAKKHKKWEMMKEYYEKVDEGFTFILQAWNEVEKQGSDHIKKPEILQAINRKIGDQMDQFRETIKKLQDLVSKAKK
jgi:Na+/phosphate symporter